MNDTNENPPQPRDTAATVRLTLGYCPMCGALRCRPENSFVRECPACRALWEQLLARGRRKRPPRPPHPGSLGRTI
jgi:hypothetical protein